MKKLWIDSQISGESALKLLKPFDERLMVAEEIDKEKFSRKKKDEDQGKLF
jgi:hypothetical protein